ncbi:hypothetical protein ACR3K2_09860 [Cryptosporidium serpentis]
MNILSFKPRVILTSDISAIAVCKANPVICKIPLIMFSPSIGVFERFTFCKLNIDLEKFPLVLIIHSINDKLIPTRDILQILNEYKNDKVRTHFIEGVGTLSATFASVSNKEIREFILEAIESEKVVEYNNRSSSFNILLPPLQEAIPVEFDPIRHPHGIQENIILDTEETPLIETKDIIDSIVNQNKNLGQNNNREGNKIAKIFAASLLLSKLQNKRRSNTRNKDIRKVLRNLNVLEDIEQ